MKIETGATLLFTGDSITDCGRDRPVGMGAGLGDGYVAQVDSLLTVFRPHEAIRVLNTGIGGNRVIDLEVRWEEDVMQLKADWLSVLIGINDVWRHFSRLLDPNPVGIDRYAATYRRLLERTRPTLKGLVLMTPYFIERNATDPMRARMDEYGRVVRQLAREFDAVFVDLQAAFNAHLAYRPTQSLCGDRVHPNRTGHTIIARAFLDAMGLAWSVEKQDYPA